MSDVRPIYPDMFEEVYGCLLERLDPGRPKHEFRRLFYPGWDRPEEHVGYGLTKGGRIVAFMGLLFSRTKSSGRSHTLCNITSWVAERRFRRESISLLFPLRSAPGLTITNLSPGIQVRAIFRRLGYDVLEEHTTIMRPPASPKAFMSPPGVRIVSDLRAISKLLDPQQGKIHRDHAPFAHHIVAETVDGYCYCIYAVRRRRRIRTALFHYLSHPAVFVRALPAIRGHVLRRHGVLIVECDTRLASGLDIPASFRIHREAPRLFTSSCLPREAVPNLYSEVVLLNLA